MKSDLPWQIRGVRRQALAAAHEAAHRCGMSVDEWLDGVILDLALQQGVEPRPSARSRYDARDEDAAADGARSASCLDMAADRLRDDVAEIGLMLQKALPRRAVAALESEVRRLADRADNTRHTDAAALARIEGGLAEMRDALRTLIPSESLSGVTQALQLLSQRIDRIGSNAQDPAALRQLEGAVVAMRGIAARVASGDALAKLSEEVRSLAGTIDQTANRISGGIVGTLEGRLAGLADTLEKWNRASQNRSSELEGLIKALIDKIERGELTRGGDSPPTPELGALSRDVADLRQAEKQSRDSLEAVHGTLGHVIDRLAMIETDMRGKFVQPDAPSIPADASSPAADVPISSSPAASEHPATFAPEEAAATTSQAPAPEAHPGAEHRLIDPGPPPDQVPESGSGAASGRDPGSPRDRTFGSEATLGVAEPSDIPDCGGKSDFIAAARRAVQAAGRQVIEKSRASTPPEIVSTSTKPAGRIGKLSALIGVITGVLAVLGGLQIARTLRSSADEAKVSALGQVAARVSVAPSAAVAADSSQVPSLTPAASPRE